MKLRIRGSSIRLRLTRSEVAAVAEHGRVEDAVDFGSDERLVYALAGTDTPTLSARFDGGSITVSVPRSRAVAWALGDEVGIESDPNASPRILIEKDFACLAPRSDEDERDNYPHPEAKAGSSC